MSTWLIGEAPTRHTTEPFTGEAGRRLNAMAGFYMHDVFKLANVLDYWPGQSKGKGTKFPVEEARQGVARILQEVSPEDSLILVGGRVARKAFRIDPTIDHYEWATLRFGTRLEGLPSRLWLMSIAYIPHPSGINQHWNEPGSVLRLRSFMEDARRISGQ